jgi:hypothetical protein
MRKILLLSFVVLLLTASCGRRITPTATITTDTQTKIDRKDSIWVDSIITVHDTITIKGDSVFIRKYIHCDSLNHIKPFEEKKKVGNASLDVVIDQNGKLTATASCDSLQRIIEEQKQLIHQLHSEKTTITKTTEKKTPVITHEPYWYDIACRWIAGIVLLIIIVFVIYSYIKLKTKII